MLIPADGWKLICEWSKRSPVSDLCDDSAAEQNYRPGDAYLMSLAMRLPHSGRFKDVKSYSTNATIRVILTFGFIRRGDELVKSSSVLVNYVYGESMASLTVNIRDLTVA